METGEGNQAFVKALSKKIGGDTLSESHVTRALWVLARAAEDEIQKTDAKGPKMARPPNGDRLAIAEYDDHIARYLLRLIKQVRAI